MYLKIIFSLILLFVNGMIYAQKCGHFFSDCHKYCRVDPRHVLCINPAVGKNCTEPFEEVLALKHAQKHILRWHNKMRQNVALGFEKKGQGGPQPSAADMLKMVWDPELAKIAQSSANQCIYKTDCKKCRNVLNERFPGIGQRVSAAQDPGDKPTRAFVTRIKQWYKNVALMKPEYVDNFVFDRSWGHYSQIVWGNTKYIGCGGVRFRSKDDPPKDEFLSFCNYGPGGNAEGEKIYTKGGPCTQCPIGTACDTEFPGLCADLPSPPSLELERIDDYDKQGDLKDIRHLHRHNHGYGYDISFNRVKHLERIHG